MHQSYSVKEQIYISKLYSLFIRRRKRGYSFAGETHDFWECLCVLNGEICVSANERVYNMKKGEIIFHKPLEFHKFSVENSPSAKYLVFSFSAAGDIIRFFEDKVFKLSDSHYKIVDNLIKYMYSMFPDIDSNDQNFATAFENNAVFSQMVITYIYQLLLTVYTNGKSASISKSQDAVVFRKAVEFMSDNISASLSLTDVARECKVSVTSLKTIFYKYTELGVHKYFLTMKINKASQLLSEGTSVTAVSEMLGFSNQAYFSNAFKRETGISPSKYKSKTDLNI